LIYLIQLKALILPILMKTRKFKKTNRSRLERKLDEVNHTMELIRTIIPVVILIVQIIILIKIFG